MSIKFLDIKGGKEQSTCKNIFYQVVILIRGNVSLLFSKHTHYNWGIISQDIYFIGNKRVVQGLISL